MNRYRTPLRRLLVLTAFVVLGWYWLGIPSRNANRFVAAIEAQDLIAADGMFADSDDRFLARWGDECAAFRAKVDVAPWSMRQILAGERHVLADVVYGRPGLLTLYEFRFAASRAGLHAPLVQSFSGGSMSLAEN